MGHCFEVQFLSSVTLPLVLVCTPGPHSALHVDHVDQIGVGQGSRLHFLCSVSPSILILNCTASPHVALQGDQRDQRSEDFSVVVVGNSDLISSCIQCRI